MKYITVDLGSTFIKAGLFDAEENRQIARKKYPTPEKRSDRGRLYYENHAREFVEIVQRIIREFCGIASDTAGILLSTQQHGCVISHPQLAEDMYISWQDTRCLKTRADTGISYLEELRARFSRADMLANGVYIKPAMAFCNLYALFEEEKLSRKQSTRIDTLGSYIIRKLTGNEVCHITNAAPLGFADILTNTWRRDMLEEIGLDFIRLPRITKELECCGTYEEGNICVQVFPDVGDVQTSVYGTSARSGDLVMNIGTSGQLIYLSDEFVPGNYEIRPFYDGNFCNVISCMPGGRNFDVQVDYIRDVGEKIFHVSLKREEVWQQIYLQEGWGETRGLEVDCGFYELPDRLADGSIRHITHENFTLQTVIGATAADFGRAYHKYAQVLRGPKAFSGRIYFTGGALLKNPLLQEAICRQFGAERIVCAQEDEVFAGMQKLILHCIDKKENPGRKGNETADSGR